MTKLGACQRRAKSQDDDPKVSVVARANSQDDEAWCLSSLREVAG